MNERWLWVVTAVIFLVVLPTICYVSYKACRLKFPDVPAWACVVK